MHRYLLNLFVSGVGRLGNTALAARLEGSREKLAPGGAGAGDITDAEVVRLGTQYRGWGITVVVLALAGAVYEVLARALTEDGNPWDETGTKIVRVIVVSLSMWLLYRSWNTRLRDRWIQARNSLEGRRFSILEQAPSDTTDIAAWFEDVRALIVDQLGYHSAKARQFDSMKRAGALAGVVGAVCLLLVSVFELSNTLEPWWVPFKLLLALCGFVVAGNSFLGVASLADQHASMHGALSDLRTRSLGDCDDNQKRAIAAELLGAMKAQEAGWKKFAMTLEFSKGA